MKLYSTLALINLLLFVPIYSEAKTYSPTIHTLEKPSNNRIIGEGSGNNSNGSAAHMAMLSSLIDKTVYFDYNSAILKDAFKPLLQEKVMILRDNPNIRLRIEGNCDVRGAEWYNNQLGSARAQVVYDYLVALGVNPAQLQTVSNGKNKLASLSSSEQAHAQNRRTTFSIISQ